MKNGFLSFFALCALLIPALPYFMATNESFQNAIWVNVFFFKSISILFLILTIALIGLSVYFLFSNHQKETPKSIRFIKEGIRQLVLLSILSLISYVKIDNLIQAWQIRKIERIFRVNNLYEKEFDQLPNQLKSHTKDSRWFLHNYSHIDLRDRKAYGWVSFKRDLLIEGFDCSLYYSKGRLNSGPFRKIREGKNGYAWYKYCMY